MLKGSQEGFRSDRVDLTLFFLSLLLLLLLLFPSDDDNDDNDDDTRGVLTCVESSSFFGLTLLWTCLSCMVLLSGCRDLAPLGRRPVLLLGLLETMVFVSMPFRATKI